MKGKNNVKGYSLGSLSSCFGAVNSTTVLQACEIVSVQSFIVTDHREKKLVQTPDINMDNFLLSCVCSIPALPFTKKAMSTAVTPSLAGQPQLAQNEAGPRD